MKKLLLAGLLATTMLGCTTTNKETTTASGDTRTPAEWSNAPVRNPSQEGSSRTYLSLNGVYTAPLANCKGTAVFERSGYDYVVRISGSMCANLKTKFGRTKLEGQGNKDRYINYKIYGNQPGYHEVQIGSGQFMDTDGKGGNGDLFIVYVPPQSVVINLNWSSGDFSNPLPRCGGTVDGRITNGQLNITFRDVDLNRCNKFDIVGNNGARTDYEAIPLTNRTQGFTIPKRFIQYGSNALVLSLSKPWAQEDRIDVYFLGVPSYSGD